MKLTLDTYCIIDAKNKIVYIGSGLECERKARTYNSSYNVREECKPFKAKYINTTFEV